MCPGDPMACTHTAAMAVLERIGGGHGTDRNVALMATTAARLRSRTLAACSVELHHHRGRDPGGGREGTTGSSLSS
jgi:hypothetical protein